MFRQGQADRSKSGRYGKLLSSENGALDALAQTVNARGALEVELGGKIEEVDNRKVFDHIGPLHHWFCPVPAFLMRRRRSRRPPAPKRPLR